MVALYNLPDRCVREVDDRFQEMVMREDDRFRIVRNFIVPHQGKVGAWDLVQRCGPCEGFIMPEDNLNAICGWRILFRLPYHNNHTVEKTAYDFVRWARANRIGTGAEAEKFWDSAKNDEDRANAADEKAMMEDAAWQVVDEMKSERKRSGQSFTGNSVKKQELRAKRRKLEKSGELEL